jgi:hypothetical protein
MDAERFLCIEKTSRDEQQEKEFSISAKAQRKISELEQSVHGLQHQLGEQEQIISKIREEFWKKLDELQKLEWESSKDLFELSITKEQKK